MLDKAQELAEKAGVLDRMTFVKGALEDLSAFQMWLFCTMSSM